MNNRWFMIGDSVNVPAIIKYARTMASHAGLGVRMHDGPVPYTDGKMLHMNKPPSVMTEDDAVRWLGTLLHEIGHNVPEMRDGFDILEEKRPDDFSRLMLNCLEDHRQEFYKHDELEGKRNLIERSHKLHVEAIVDGIGSKKLPDPEQQKQMSVLETMIAWDSKEREEWQPSLAPIVEQILEKLDQQQTEWYNKLVAGDYGKILKSGITAKEEFELLERIMSEVFEIEVQTQAQGGGGKGEGEDGEGEDEGQDGEGEGSGEDGEEGKDKKGKGKKKVIPYSELLKHHHEEKDRKKAYSKDMTRIEYDTNTGKYDASRPPKILDYDKEAYTPDASCLRQIRSVQVNGGLQNTVRRLLQARLARRYQHGLKRGKVSSKSIYRAGVKDSGHFQEKVFKKRKEDLFVNAAVSILVDCSGSMSGKKYHHAAKAAIMLNNALKPLSIPFEIACFDDHNSGILHGVVKNFNKPLDESTLEERFAAHEAESMSQNADGESILLAYSRLIRQKAPKKLLIVFSDGSPASWYGDADFHTKQVITSIEKEGVIDLYGIGIMDNNVTRLYRQHQVIKRADELEDALLNLIKTKLIIN